MHLNTNFSNTAEPSYNPAFFSGEFDDRSNHLAHYQRTLNHGLTNTPHYRAHQPQQQAHPPWLARSQGALKPYAPIQIYTTQHFAQSAQGVVEVAKRPQFNHWAWVNDSRADARFPPWIVRPARGPAVRGQQRVTKAAQKIQRKRQKSRGNPHRPLKSETQLSRLVIPEVDGRRRSVSVGNSPVELVGEVEMEAERGEGEIQSAVSEPARYRPRKKSKSYAWLSRGDWQQPKL